MAKDRPVYGLDDKQFGQWKDGQRVTGPVRGGCLPAMVALPFTLLLALLRRKR